MKVVLVYNPKSGSSKKLPELRRLFLAHGITISTAIAICDGFEKKLHGPIKRGEIISVIGGDGTISAVSAMLVDTTATLMPFSGGTLNHFTKDLAVPQELDKALTAARRSKPQTIDIADINGTFFINNSSIGLYPQSLSTRNRIEDTFGKWPSALIGALRALIRFHHYRCELDGQQIVTPFIFVGNNDYRIGENGLTERKSVTGGILSVAVVHATSRIGLMKIFVAAARGQIDTADNFDQFIVKDHLVITTRRRSLNISHDGELSRFNTPITYTIHKKALRVLV